MAATLDYIPARHEASTYIMSMGDTDAGTALRGGTPSSSNATSTSTTANTVARLIDKYVFIYLSV